jgi:magnesium-transporting ATPase (P-type)
MLSMSQPFSISLLLHIVEKKTDLTKGLHSSIQDNYVERQKAYCIIDICQYISFTLTHYKYRFGENVYPEKKLKSIFYYILEALKDVTLIILMVAAAVSLIFAFIQTEEENAWLDSLGIFVAILLVTSVTSFNNWSKERQFRELNRVKEKRIIKVVREGKTIEIFINDVMVGDLVSMETGDQLPADGMLTLYNNNNN